MREDRHGDAARLLHAAVGRRLATAVTDLFLPGEHRLTEWHRTTMAALLDRLLRSVEDDLRAALAPSFGPDSHPALHAALTAAHVEIVRPILDRSPVLEDPDLTALLLRRVEEHRLHRAAGPTATIRHGLLLELVRDSDTAVAESAMALLIAQSRRLDRFQEPAIASVELPAEIEHRLVWTTAAALRCYLILRHGIAPGHADQAIGEAAMARLAAFDEGDCLEARSSELVRRLEELGRLDGAFTCRALIEAGLPLFLACLSLRCGLGLDATWEVLCDPRGHGAPLLLRAAGLNRRQAGEVLVTLSSAAGAADEESLSKQLQVFDGCSDAAAHAVLRLWQLDPAYRQAVARLTAPTSAEPS